MKKEKYRTCLKNKEETNNLIFIYRKRRMRVLNDNICCPNGERVINIVTNLLLVGSTSEDGQNRLFRNPNIGFNTNGRWEFIIGTHAVLTSPTGYVLYIFVTNQMNRRNNQQLECSSFLGRFIVGLQTTRSGVIVYQIRPMYGPTGRHVIPLTITTTPSILKFLWN